MAQETQKQIVIQNIQSIIPGFSTSERYTIKAIAFSGSYSASAFSNSLTYNSTTYRLLITDGSDKYYFIYAEGDNWEEAITNREQTSNFSVSDGYVMLENKRVWALDSGNGTRIPVRSIGTVPDSHDPDITCYLSTDLEAFDTPVVDYDVDSLTVTTDDTKTEYAVVYVNNNCQGVYDVNGSKIGFSDSQLVREQVWALQPDAAHWLDQFGLNELGTKTDIYDNLLFYYENDKGDKVHCNAIRVTAEQFNYVYPDVSVPPEVVGTVKVEYRLIKDSQNDAPDYEEVYQYGSQSGTGALTNDMFKNIIVYASFEDPSIEGDLKQYLFGTIA